MLFIDFDRFFQLLMTMFLVSILVRTLLFTLVGVSSFAIWAFCSDIFRSTTSLYTACAFVFLVFGGVSLLPFSGSDKAKNCLRILWLFPISFLIFAICWCVGWFTFRNHFGEIVGSAVGIMALTGIFKTGLAINRSMFEAACVVFFCYTIGYYMGEKANQEIAGIAGKLLWGGGFGLGMGFGISYLISLSKAPS